MLNLTSQRTLSHYLLFSLLLMASIGAAQDTLELEGATFTSNVVTVNGMDMHYVMGGEGEPIVLVHGWPQTWREWENIMPQLAENHTVIALDLRGAGRSSITEGGYDKRTMAADIHALILALGLEPVHFVGHDIGGMVAYAFANDYPEATRTVTILDVPLAGVDPYWTQSMLSPATWHISFHQQEEVPERLTAGREPFYICHFMEENALDTSAVEESCEEAAQNYAREGRMTAGFEWYRAFEQDAEDNAVFGESPLEMPVLALGGGASLTFVLDMMEGLGTDVQGGVIEDSGHWLTEEQPEALSQRLLEFFSSQSASTR